MSEYKKKIRYVYMSDMAVVKTCVGVIRVTFLSEIAAKISAMHANT